MAEKALFAGLVVDEQDRPVPTAVVGNEAFYVIDDAGFQRHVESERIDRQVLARLAEQIRGNEELISEGTMKILGQEDIFTKAAIEASLRNLDDQFAAMLTRGIPEEARAWLGMSGFRVIVDLHGDVVRVEQPQGPEEPPDE